MESHEAPKTQVIGRILRLALGVFFITEVWPVYAAVNVEGVIVRLVWTAGLVTFYLLLHFIVSRFMTQLHQIVGAILSFAPVLLVFFIGYGGPAATGALTFIAASLILAGLRADPGCEVMSIPALLLRRHTHLACLIFSPIDGIERKINRD